VEAGWSCQADYAQLSCKQVSGPQYSLCTYGAGLCKPFCGSLVQKTPQNKSVWKKVTCGHSCHHPLPPFPPLPSPYFMVKICLEVHYTNI
jgi:hypothetical protein